MRIFGGSFVESRKRKWVNFFCGLSLVSSIITTIYAAYVLREMFQFNVEDLELFAAKTVLNSTLKTSFENIILHKNYGTNDNDFDNFNEFNFLERKNVFSDKSVKKTQNSLDKEKVENDSEKFTGKLSSDGEIIGIDDEKHSAGEKTYPVIETHFAPSGTIHENVCVKNTTNFNLDIASELSKKPEITIKNTSEPQVLIFHTHTSEGYMTHDRNFCYESFYPRSKNNSENVTMVGNAIVKSLKKNGINAIHCIVQHDNPTYNGSYVRAAKTIREYIEKYPSIQVVIDVHRDSIGDSTSGKVKPTFVFNGKKAAQMMIISGCDINGKNDFPNWEKNLRLTLRVQKACESMFPGMMRAMKFAEVKYNMNLTPGSMLIEVGSDVNTLTEAVYTGEMFGQALSKILNTLKN